MNTLVPTNRSSAWQVVFTPRRRAFTLVELLVVIGLIGLITLMAVPAFKGFGQSNKLTAAQRQLSDDLAFARQTAIKNRTTVYMVFFVHPRSDDSDKFDAGLAQIRQAWLSLLGSPVSQPLAQWALRQFTNVYAGYNASYAFYTEQTVGDQPGVHRQRYLSVSGNIWRSLPEGIYFAPFMEPVIGLGGTVARLDVKEVPFPIARDQFPGIPSQQFQIPTLRLPTLVFDSQGRLARLDTTTGQPVFDAKRQDRFVAVGLASVLLPKVAPPSPPPGQRPARTVDYAFGQAVDIVETPPMNYTNTLFRVAALTGRSRKQTWPVFP
jgi:prepilin-type N-terminal cleavage/methylation domain-containing protein